MKSNTPPVLCKEVCKKCLKSNQMVSLGFESNWHKGLVKCKLYTGASIWVIGNGCPPICPNKLNHIVEGQKSIKNKRLPKPN
jgi:hypothetical protein